MPPKSVRNKTPCSLCHQVVEELKFHYDLCEPCHQDFLDADVEEELGSDTEDSIDSEAELGPYSDRDMEDEPPFARPGLTREPIGVLDEDESLRTGAVVLKELSQKPSKPKSTNP